MPTKKPLSFEGVHQFLKTLFAQDLHAKRVLSLAGATLGVIESASLAVGMIGQGLALARGRLTKHAVKQVDRLLSNPGIEGRRPAAPLGALRGGQPDQHHGGDGLDQLRCRWPDDDHAVDAVWPWPGDAAGLADGRDRHAEGSAQRYDVVTSICVVLLAEACNTEFEPLIRRGTRLSWVRQNYIRAEFLTPTWRLPTGCCS